MLTLSLMHRKTIANAITRNYFFIIQMYLAPTLLPMVRYLSSLLEPETLYQNSFELATEGALQTASLVFCSPEVVIAHSSNGGRC